MQKATEYLQERKIPSGLRSHILTGNRPREFSKEDVVFSIVLKAISPEAYDFVREELSFLNIPSKLFYIIHEADDC